MTEKYPRTPHLPWSPGATSDDKRIIDVSTFVGKRVVVTEKMDGENTTISRDGCHARSLDTAPHPSRSWVRALAGKIGHQVPVNWSFVGENLFAEHSIHYCELPDYFLMFGVHAGDICMSWRLTVFESQRLDLKTVPVLYRGVWDESAVRACMTGKSKCGGDQEGYVVRLDEAFPLAEFNRSVAKFVRAEHVQTDEHWLSKPVVKNQLRDQK